jgi:hypothetical protein
MISNSVPNDRLQLIALGRSMLFGLNSLGETLNLVQITPEAFQLKLTAYINGEAAFSTARDARGAAYDAFHTADVIAGDRKQAA